MKPPSSKEEHEEKPWTSQQWQQRQNSTEVQNTESGIIRNGFLTLCLLRKSLQKWVSLHLHLWTIFVSMPSKDLAFPLCSLSLSLLFYFTVCWGKLSGTLIFLVSVAAEVLGFVWFQFLCIIPNLGISGNCKLWLPNQALNTLVFFNCHN